MPENSKQRLIIFTRYPEAGTTKTRMIPELGAEGAAELQRRMTEHIMSRAVGLCDLHPIPVEVRYEGGSEKLMTEWLGPGFSYCHQGSGDIGLRMGRAFTETFGQGCESVVIIGSDIPDISTKILQNAFEALGENDLVLGPAADGGYYLIGVQRETFRHWNPQLFSDIRWGTASVLPQTLHVARKLGLNYKLLATLRDVDRPEDLDVWHQASDPALLSSESELISIIIPTLNEARTIEPTISDLIKISRAEIIVVDGGSRDDTPAMAAALGARVLSSAPCKAKQMNAGAAAAGGEILLFLHADTRLPRNFEDSISAALSQEGVIAGAFSLGIDSDGGGLRIIERVANWRSRFLQMPYGDQALFCTRKLFHEIGGYPEYQIMEDFELVRRLKRKGKIAIRPESVQTSPRRWLNYGIFRTWLLNQIIIIAYYLGISPRRLSRWYRREKGKF
ncbi:MAG: TIGR04283 family arsenosugar biosynthesis glycosyltransferase [Deltaproteobacteria bacterium]|jgi:rSAM/selenodomain-associated transferase 2/rSAM/selenodomain-associated transferase 1|nr:TIGR04283 family arsenosugar biosynthesis glycosyltransferase [Deltaproteobacteria bacterium]